MKFIFNRRIFSSQGISFFLLTVAITINAYVRLAPAYFPQARDKAKAVVTQRIQTEMAMSIDEKYPAYKTSAKAKIIKELFREEAKKNNFSRLVALEYKKLVEPYQDNSGYTYLLELDPYQWMRNTENVLTFGHPGTEIKEGKIYDTYMLAPVGMEVPHIRSLFYCSAFLYKLYSFFFHNASLFHFLFYLPVIYSTLFLIVLYFFSRNFFSTLGAFFTALFVGLDGILITRSCAGWFDYDTLSLIMPIAIIWCLSSAFVSYDNWKRLIVFSLCASFFQGLYTFTWIGWWFIFLVIIAAIAFIILNNYFLGLRFSQANKENIPYASAGLIFIAGSVFFCFIISRVNLLKEFFSLLRENIGLGASFTQSIWPDVRYTIAELQPPGIPVIASNFYNKIIAVTAMLGLIWVYFREKRGKYKFVLYSMVFWTAFMLYATLKAGRFSIYLLIPLGFFLGWAINAFWVLLREKLGHIPKAHFVCVAIFACILSYMGGIFISAGVQKSRTIYPIMNDEWFNLLTFVKNNTPKEAILNSWWDFGDFFKAVGRRRVIFDGQSQKGFIAYWISQAMLEKDENRALRILKMLNNASDTTFDTLNIYVADQFKAYALLEKLLTSNREEGARLLNEYKIPASSIRKILDDLHNKPAPAYFIVDRSMLVKMSSISFLGNWDFSKVFIAHNINKPESFILTNLKDIFNLSDKEALEYYKEVLVNTMGHDRSVSESFSNRYNIYNFSPNGSLSGRLVHFANGIVYDIDSKDVLIYSEPAMRYMRPMKIFFYEDGKKEVLSQEKGDFKKSICIIKTGDKYASLVLDEPLIDSLFFRLMFNEARNCNHFKPFFTSGNKEVSVYQIYWDTP
ncbi:MAG: STT3 domain-containing protein [Candidatus Omnitrophica bacterium]|nr:STT3 domain-containing protein [Candidatus Omnitrophota bacterium]